MINLGDGHRELQYTILFLVAHNWNFPLKKSLPDTSGKHSPSNGEGTLSPGSQFPLCGGLSRSLGKVRSVWLWLCLCLVIRKMRLKAACLSHCQGSSEVQSEKVLPSLPGSGHVCEGGALVAWLPPACHPAQPSELLAFKVRCRRAASHIHTLCFSKYLGSSKHGSGKWGGELQ